MAEIVSLADGVHRLVRPGATIALEGFSHLVPFAAGHEIIRRRIGGLTIVRMVPDIIVDQMIGAGIVDRLVFSWAGNPGVGSLHRFRDAVEHGWPRPLAIEEHTHASLAARFVAGAAGLPMGILRAYAGTSLADHAPDVRLFDDPFSGQRLAAVAAIRPDVAIIHAQRADRAGNVQLWGITGVQKEAVLAARESLVTVEEIVDALDPVPGAVVLPGWIITVVASAPGGSYPSYTLGYSGRDDAFYAAWDLIARDRERFLRWMADNQLPAMTDA